ncbi:hypothetical protein [Cupriavidus malaysiensis]|uniref:Uncharacterized protein n=1 Tax=Cupriavidus malaysiensis TaxID=367825 RepID=A0ABM6FH01_9BURK|nr:hypothetical protein [Cupriavidus malaysiensis]AOZ11170.1 hypothetical protein BKK80_35040 [Cupriavidus malaysiensis]
MRNSISLTIGQSYLPDLSVKGSSLIRPAVEAIERNPGAAADIALATTDRLIRDTPDQPQVLRAILKEWVAAVCVVRDRS